MFTSIDFVLKHKFINVFVIIYKFNNYDFLLANVEESYRWTQIQITFKYNAN